MSIPSSKSDSPFRDNILTYTTPDRVAWEAAHGKKPYELMDVEPRYIAQARRQLIKDFSTIERTAAISAHAVLDEICEGVLYRAGLSDAHVVHFDNETNSFWVYPLTES